MRRAVTILDSSGGQLSGSHASEPTVGDGRTPRGAPHFGDVGDRYRPTRSRCGCLGSEFAEVVDACTLEVTMEHRWVGIHVVG